jgi:hypothetical protein
VRTFFVSISAAADTTPSSPALQARNNSSTGGFVKGLMMQQQSTAVLTQCSTERQHCEHAAKAALVLCL